MNRKQMCLAAAAAAVIAGCLIFFRRDAQTPLREPETKAIPAQPRPDRTKPPAPRPPARPADSRPVTPDDRILRRLSPEIREKLEKQAREAASPEALKRERALAAVVAWEKLVDEVVEEDNPEPLPERGKKLKAALQTLDEDDKNTCVQTLLNLLPDDRFAMVDDLLLDPQGDREVIDALFSDLLNRPEKLKEGYILKISEMRDHPSFTDAMHIRTVTNLGKTDEEE